MGTSRVKAVQGPMVTGGDQTADGGPAMEYADVL